MVAEAATFSPVIPPEVERLAVGVMRAACDRGIAIVTAESCTGGLLAALLTDIEGCSHAFERGFVSYTNAAKVELLGIDPGLLDRCGAVSAEIALAMARGALDASDGTLALSITGFTDAPQGQGEAGLVYFGVADRRGPATAEEHHFGDVGRATIRIACLRVALGILQRRMNEARA